MEFKNYFLSGSLSSVVSIAVALIYINGYYSILWDFSTVINLTLTFSYFVLAGISLGIIDMLISKLMSKKGLASFLFGVLVVISLFVFVFYYFSAADPSFEGTDFEGDEDFSYIYKQFVIPLIFIPALTYFTLKPLFIKS